MENFATANFLEGIKLATISIYFSKSPFDDLGSVSLARLTGREPIIYFKEGVKEKRSFNLDFLIGGFGLTKLGFSLQFLAFYST